MRNILLISAIGFLFHSCKPDDPVQPPTPPDVNERGEYFNCYIDGKYWTYKQGSFTSNDHLSAKKVIRTGTEYRIQAIDGSGNSNTAIVFSIVGEGFPSKDTVNLASYAQSAYAEINGPNANFFTNLFSTDASATGKLIFSKRTQDRIEGTFYFDAQTPDTNVIIQVTSGRFSIIPD